MEKTLDNPYKNEIYKTLTINDKTFNYYSLPDLNDKRLRTHLLKKRRPTIFNPNSSRSSIT